MKKPTKTQNKLLGFMAAGAQMTRWLIGEQLTYLRGDVVPAPTREAMEREGWIECVERQQSPPAEIYAITEAGRSAWRQPEARPSSRKESRRGGFWLKRV